MGSKFFSTKRTLKVALKYKQMQYYILRKILCKEFEYLMNIFLMYISNKYMTVPNIQ